jgi:hypothetical protein
VPAHYHLRSFLRQLSRELLTELFEYHSIEIGVGLSALKKRQIDPIFASVSSLLDDERKLLDEDFRDIVSLATPAGISQIIEEARFQGFDIVQGLHPIGSLIDRVAWTCLHNRPVFKEAVRLAARELRPGRYWNRRLPVKPLPGADLNGAVNSVDIISAEGWSLRPSGSSG